MRMLFVSGSYQNYKNGAAGYWSADPTVQEWNECVRGDSESVGVWKRGCSILCTGLQMRGGGLPGLSQWVQLHIKWVWHGAQINFGDLNPYLTYAYNTTGILTTNRVCWGWQWICRCVKEGVLYSLNRNHSKSTNWNKQRRAKTNYETPNTSLDNIIIYFYLNVLTRYLQAHLVISLKILSTGYMIC